MPTPIFELFRTIELDVALRDGITVRIELLRARGEPGVYRARVLRSDLFRLTPSFPRDEDGEPTERTDDGVLVDWSAILSGDYERFTAQDDDAAEALVLADVQRGLAAASWAI
jgi:hypothetical protein